MWCVGRRVPSCNGQHPWLRWGVLTCCCVVVSEAPAGDATDDMKHGMVWQVTSTIVAFANHRIRVAVRRRLDLVLA
jgi:hypothetical protein